METEQRMRLVDRSQEMVSLAITFDSFIVTNNYNDSSISNMSTQFANTCY